MSGPVAPAPVRPRAATRRRRSTRRIVLIVLSLVLLLVLVLGLLAYRLLAPRSSEGLEFDPGSGPGSLVSARTFSDLSPALRLVTGRAAKVEYHSTDSSGQETVVSGGLFLPRGKPPTGGWPTIAVAHATVGILPACAPTLYPDLRGSEGQVAALVSAGYAVALTDYQGLGGPGAHPYLDNSTAARNVIDSVRAIRSLWSTMSTRWAAVGLSQGGGAAWAADEIASSYAPSLRFEGAAVVSPAADVAGMVSKAASGTLTADQLPAFQWILAAIARTDPSFDLDEYRDPSLASSWSAMSQCAPARVAERNQAITALQPTSLAPRTPEAATALVRRLESMAAARRPLTAPLLVLYGSNDTLIDPAWTTAAVERQRQLDAAAGDPVPLTATLQQGKDHGSVDISPVVPFLQAVLPRSG